MEELCFTYSSYSFSVGAPIGYALVWNDEFDVAGRPSSEWWYETGGGGWGNNESQVYVAGSKDGIDIASISEGTLKIKAQKIGSTVYSTRMNTERSWKYGYFEARLESRFPTFREPGRPSR